MAKANPRKLLAELIRDRGEATTERTRDGRRSKRREILTQFLWDAITEGTVRMPNGVVMEFGPKDWVDLVKWVLGYLEPPETRVKLAAGDGTSLAATVGGMTDEQLASLVKRADKYRHTADVVADTVDPPFTDEVN